MRAFMQFRRCWSQEANQQANTAIYGLCSIRNSIESGKQFDLLFQSRQKGDYSDYVRFDAEEVADWLEKTQRVVEEIRDYFIREGIL